MMTPDELDRLGRRLMDKELLKRYHKWKSRFIDVILCLITVLFILNLDTCMGMDFLKKNKGTSFINMDTIIYDDLRKAVTRVCD